MFMIFFVFYPSFGTFSFAYYTMGLEFNVELTYPVDQTSGMAIIFAIGQIQAAIFIIVSGALETPLTPDAQEKEVKLQSYPYLDYIRSMFTLFIIHSDILYFLLSISEMFNAVQSYH